MRSSCPHCLSLTEHAHDEAQVTCSSCGQTFSPFLTNSDSAPTSDFSESSLAFQDIVNFGESLGKDSSPHDSAVAVTAAASMPAGNLAEHLSEQSHLEAATHSSSGTSGLILSTASSLPSQAPHVILPPVSLMVVMGDDQAPLENGFKMLSDLATQIQADGIIGIRCSLSPDNRRALLIGTPIRWEKK